MYYFKLSNNPRLLLIRFHYFIFFYMLAEGCFRKWLFPNYYVEIYFLKDIFLLFIYLFAIKYEFFLKKRLEKILIALAALVSLWGLIGYIIDGHSIAAYFLGLRSYWIFLPIAFIIANTFEADDLIKFIKINFYIIIPYFFLILLQTYSPESSIINSGYNSVVLAPHRPTGFFTFTTQNTFFIIFLSVLFYMYILYIKTLSKDALRQRMKNSVQTCNQIKRADAIRKGKASKFLLVRVVPLRPVKLSRRDNQELN